MCGLWRGQKELSIRSTNKAWLQGVIDCIDDGVNGTAVESAACLANVCVFKVNQTYANGKRRIQRLVCTKDSKGCCEDETPRLLEEQISRLPSLGEDGTLPFPFTLQNERVSPAARRAPRNSQLTGSSWDFHHSLMTAKATQ